MLSGRIHNLWSWKQFPYCPSSAWLRLQRKWQLGPSAGFPFLSLTCVFIHSNNKHTRTQIPIIAARNEDYRGIHEQKWMAVWMTMNIKPWTQHIAWQPLSPAADTDQVEPNRRDLRWHKLGALFRLPQCVATPWIRLWKLWGGITHDKYMMVCQQNSPNQSNVTVTQGQSSSDSWVCYHPGLARPNPGPGDPLARLQMFPCCNTPDWNKWLIERLNAELIIWIRCTGAGTYLKHAGKRVPSTMNIMFNCYHVAVSSTLDTECKSWSHLATSQPPISRAASLAFQEWRQRWTMKRWTLTFYFLM